MDIAIALLPSLLFGSLGIVIMKLGGDSRQQSLGEFLGAFIVASGLLLFLGLDLSWSKIAVSFLSGILLCVGVSFQIKAFHVIGVSRSMPASTGGQLLGVSLLGILLFSEWRGPGALPVGLLGLALVLVGILMTTWNGKNQVAGSVVSATESVDLPKGLLLVGISTVGLVFALVTLRWFDIDPLQAYFPQACGFLLMGFILTSPRFTPELGKKDTRWSKYTARQVISGMIWGIGTIILQVSMSNVGVATGFTLSQLGVIIGTLGGIFILKERRSKRELIVVVLGIAVLVIGAVLIGIANGLDS